MWYTQVFKGKLKILDLSFNRLSRIENLDCLKCLQKLDLRGNDVKDVTNIYKLNCNQSLDTLYLQSLEGNHANPCCHDMNYLSVVRDSCKELIILDGGHIALEDATQVINELSEGINHESIGMEFECDPWIDVVSMDLYMKSPQRERAGDDEINFQSSNLVNTVIHEQSSVLLRKMNAAVERLKRTIPV